MSNLFIPSMSHLLKSQVAKLSLDNMKDCVGEFLFMVIAECLIPPIVSCICDEAGKVIRNAWDKRYNSTEMLHDKSSVDDSGQEQENIIFINKILSEEGYELQLPSNNDNK